MSKVSQMVIAMQSLADTIERSEGKKPEGLFGRVVLITTKDLTIDGSKLDVEFTVPFDDDSEANEAEIIIYNLSEKSRKLLKYNTQITITAGYGSDTGIVFSGYISKAVTKRDGNDLKTTISAIDSMELKERKIDSIAYNAGVTASYILKDLISRAALPLAVFKPRRDYTYKDSVTVSGELMNNIKKYAEVCGISVYILKGKAYARHIKDGDNIEFTVSVDTGMIGSPEEFEEEITAEDFKDIVKGYKMKMLLQHRVTTAAIIDLKSRDVNGKFRVRSGQHVCGGSDFFTEMEVIS
jgi:hypothetical protein